MTLYRKKARVYEATFNAAMGAFGQWTLVPCTLDRKPLPAVAHQIEVVSPDELQREWEAVPQHIGANPDSALRQALVAAEKAIRPFGDAADHGYWSAWSSCKTGGLDIGDLRRAREAHALITEALKDKL